MSSITDTIATGAVSLTAITIAPEVAEVTANAVNLPISDIIQIVMQVATGLATLYKLFFHKPKSKKVEENV
jgi:hypothetical protein